MSELLRSAPEPTSSEPIPACLDREARPGLNPPGEAPRPTMLPTGSGKVPGQLVSGATEQETRGCMVGAEVRTERLRERQGLAQGHQAYQCPRIAVANYHT